jgi:DNA (cytosine-5)-methyltransferase 1
MPQNDRAMRIGSLFSGIGGLELGLEWAGLGETAWQVEKSDFCRHILRRHWPGVARFEDVRDVGAHNLAPVDLICGGFPCQDVSSAGKGAGLAGERSGLWYQFARIVGELRPAWVVVENVASGASRWVDAVVRGLGQLGYETLPLPVSAEDVGAPHRRARIFLVAHACGEPLRVEPGRGRRSHGKGEALTRLAGEKGATAHALGPRLEKRQEQPVRQERPAAQRVGGGGPAYQPRRKPRTSFYPPWRNGPGVGACKPWRVAPGAACLPCLSSG